MPGQAMSQINVYGNGIRMVTVYAALSTGCPLLDKLRAAQTFDALSADVRMDTANPVEFIG